MAKRFTDTEKYKKSFYRNLPTEYKLLWDYLYHDCSNYGVWDVDMEVANIRIGEICGTESALKHFNKDEQRVIAFDNGKKWFIPSFITFQYGEDLIEKASKNRMHAQIVQHLRRLDLIKFIPVRGPLEDPLERVMEQEQDKEKEIKGIVKGKTKLEELKVIFEGKGFPAEAEKFFDYYEANGWRVGKNPMKSVNAAVANWLRNGSKFGTLDAPSKKPKKGCEYCAGKGYVPQGFKCGCWS